MSAPVLIAVAEEGDWDRLAPFFRRTYRVGHPLRAARHWRWAFGDGGSAGASILAERAGRVVGHLGAVVGAGRAWTIALHLDEEARGQGALRRMYGLARQLGPLAATNSNAAARALHERQGWVRHPDLVRSTIVRPDVVSDVVRPALFDGRALGPPPDRHYFRQPGIEAATMADGSSAVLRPDVGGVRVVGLADPVAVAELAWEVGARWVDLVTSANDPLLPALRAAGWRGNDDQPVPWLLDPVVPGSRADLSLMSEGGLPPDLVVTSECSDHGRVGTLSEEG